MSEAAGEGVLTVASLTRLELKTQTRQTDRVLRGRGGEGCGWHGGTAADLLQVVDLQQRSHERFGPLLGRLGAVQQASVGDEAERTTQKRQHGEGLKAATVKFQLFCFLTSFSRKEKNNNWKAETLQRLAPKSHT